MSFMLWRQMGIAHGHRDILVAQNFLQILQVSAAHQEMTGESVPEIVEPHVREIRRGQAVDLSRPRV